MSLVAEKPDIERTAAVNRFLGRVRRRLFLGRLLQNAAGDLIIILSLLAALVAADRILWPGVAEMRVVAGLFVLGGAVSLGRTLLFGRLKRERAAALADERLGLKERVSTAVYMEEAGRSDELGRLVFADAARHVAGAPLAERFPIRPPGMFAWSLVPLAACLALVLWLPSWDLLGLAGRKEASARDAKAVDEEKKKLEEKLNEVAKKAEEKNLPDARKLLELLAQKAQEAQDPAKKPSDPQKAEKTAGEPRKEALVEMTRREDELRKGLEGQRYEPLKDALKALSAIDLKDPTVTRKLQEALKSGDFKKAKEELAGLQDELSRLKSKDPSELTPEEKARLEKLSEELGKLSKDAKSLSKLSSALSRASTGLSSSQLSEALEGLSQSRDELEQLSRLAEEMDLLDQALELVQLSKEELASLQSCPECGTPYCSDCGKPQCSCKPGTKPGGT